MLYFWEYTIEPIATAMADGYSPIVWPFAIGGRYGSPAGHCSITNKVEFLQKAQIPVQWKRDLGGNPFYVFGRIWPACNPQ